MLCSLRPESNIGKKHDENKCNLFRSCDDINFLLTYFFNVSPASVHSTCSHTYTLHGIVIAEIFLRKCRCFVSDRKALI